MDLDKKPKIVIRLQTFFWSNSKGIYSKKQLTYLKRKCEGFNFVEEDAIQNIDYVFCRIVNLDECIDGIYKIVPCNECLDWETGTIEDWNYRLVPYKE